MPLHYSFIFMKPIIYAAFCGPVSAPDSNDDDDNDFLEFLVVSLLKCESVICA